jgi:hypothetical protein
MNKTEGNDIMQIMRDMERNIDEKLAKQLDSFREILQLHLKNMDLVICHLRDNMTDGNQVHTQTHNKHEQENEARFDKLDLEIKDHGTRLTNLEEAPGRELLALKKETTKHIWLGVVALLFTGGISSFVTWILTQPKGGAGP